MEKNGCGNDPNTKVYMLSSVVLLMLILQTQTWWQAYSTFITRKKIQILFFFLYDPEKKNKTVHLKASSK